MDYQAIKVMCQKKGITIDSMAEQIGMSRTGLTASLKSGTLKVESLEKISEILDVSPCIFFQNEGNNQNQEAKYKFLKEEILAKGEIYIDTFSFFDKIRRGITISKDLVLLINKTLTKEEITKVLKTSLQPSDSFSNEIKEDMPHLLSKIQEIANERYYDTLYFEIVNEKGLWNLNLVETALNDHKIKFLREENLIDDSELLNTISIFTFDIESSYNFLLKYFEIKDIRRAFKLGKNV